MKSVLESAARAFCQSDHIKNIYNGIWVTLQNELGEELPGIRGRIGAASISSTGHEIGVDLIEMQPGSAFPLHVHPGDHILFVVRGEGCVSIDSVDHIVKDGDTIFIPAEYPHGVKTLPGYESPFTFLAFGHPHTHLSAADRMRIVE